MNNYISTAPLYDSVYLAHHGIKGQKWGVRRFQNSDGTLTEAGKKHYLKTIEKRENRYAKIISKDKSQYNKLYANRTKATDKALHEFGESKEFNDYAEALAKLEDFYENSYNGVATKRMTSLKQKYDKSQGIMHETLHKIFQEHQNEIVSASLQDLKMPASQAFIDLYKEYNNGEKW